MPDAVTVESIVGLCELGQSLSIRAVNGGFRVDIVDEKTWDPVRTGVGGTLAQAVHSTAHPLTAKEALHILDAAVTEVENGGGDTDGPVCNGLGVLMDWFRYGDGVKATEDRGQIDYDEA